MNTFDSPDALDAATKEALIDLLYRMADDEIVLGHRDSEWTGHAPIIEEDIAFSSMAQDEMGHALAYYNLLTELGEPDADTMAFGRKASDYRCASLVCLPKGDWAFSLVRQYLFDAAEGVRLAALAKSTYTPLANVARKLAGEEKYHLMHGRTWIVRIGAATDESRRRMQIAVDEAYPHALGLFEPTSADEVLAHSGICPMEADLRAQWEASVAPVLAEAELKVPEGSTPQYGGRTGEHPAALAELLESMQLVYNIDPSAKW